jgi:hypothetical protein
MTDTPFICNLNALSDSQKDRYRQLTRILNESRQSVKELNDGYAFRFIAESQLILDAAEFIARFDSANAALCLRHFRGAQN